MLPALLCLILCQDLNMSGAEDVCLVMSGSGYTADKPDKRRQLDFYGPTWCPHCPAAKKQVAALSDLFIIRHFSDDEKYPQHIKDAASQPGWGYPLIHWEMKSGKGKMMVWRGVEAFLKEDGLVVEGVTGNTKAKVGSVSVAKWSINGSNTPSRNTLLSHLLNDGIHRGRHSREQLEGLTTEQLRWLHDVDHGVKYSRQQAAICPTGTCPKQPSRYKFGALFGSSG